MSEPEGVVLHDVNTDKLITPSTFVVLTPEGKRLLHLRVGRGTIRDLPSEKMS